MPIISVSLPEKVLHDIDKLAGRLGFSGRSDAVRAGIRSLVSENTDVEKLSGRVKSVLLFVHNEDAEHKATSFKHSFEDIIATQIHSNLEKGKCLEIFVLDGRAERVKEIVKQAKSNRKVEYAKLVVP